MSDRLKEIERAYNNVTQDDDLGKDIRWLISEVESLRRQLATSKGTICEMREAANGIADFIDDIRKDGSCDFFNEKKKCEPGETAYSNLRQALSSTPTCPHVEAEKKWRRTLWLRHGCSLAAHYGDDGEMQCSKCLIDFKRQPIESIIERWEFLGRAALSQKE